MKKRYLSIAMVAVAALGLTACASDASGSSGGDTVDGKGQTLDV